MIDNTPEQIGIRRARDVLVLVGQGIIAFGAWSIVRTMAVIFTQREGVLQEMRMSLEGESTAAGDWLLLLLFFIMLGIIMAAVFGIQYLVGRSAIAEGKGKKPGILYIPGAMALAAVSLFETVRRLLDIFRFREAADTTPDSTVAGIVVEMTIFIMLVEMLAASRTVRKDRKQKTRREKRHAA